MSDRNVYDFVCCFLSEHKPFWDCLTEYEFSFFNNFPYEYEDVLKKLIFSPEENPELVEKIRDRMEQIEMILKHRECVYDNFLYWKIRCSSYLCINNQRYNFIFENPQKYAIQIKEPKTIASYMKKITALLPQCYQKKTKNSDSSLFGHFITHIDSVTFEAGYEEIEFNRSQMNLIPFFIEYRCKNFLTWISQANAQKQYLQSLNKKTSSFFAQSFYLKAQETIAAFEPYCRKQINELLMQYNLIIPPFWIPTVDYYEYEGFFKIIYDSKSGAQYTYILRTDDILNNLKKFHAFLGNTEKQYLEE